MVVQYTNTGPLSLSKLQTEFNSTFNSWSSFQNVAGTSPTSLSDFYGLQSNMIAPVLRLDATSLQHLGVGSNVASWSNTGTWGNGYHFSLASGVAPTLGTSNGEYHVTFNGNSFLRSSGTAINFNWLNNAGPTYEGFTFITVMRATNYNARTVLLQMGTSANTTSPEYLTNWVRLATGGFETSIVTYNGTTLTNLTNCIKYPTLYDDFHIIIWRVGISASGTTCEIIIDDETDTIMSSTTTILTNRAFTNINTIFGGFMNNTGYVQANAMRADIRDFMLFNKTLSKSELYSWIKYLRNRWKLTIANMYEPSILGLDVLSLATTRGVTSEAAGNWKLSGTNGNTPWYYTSSANAPLVKYNANGLPYLEMISADTKYFNGAGGNATFTLNAAAVGVTHVHVGLFSGSSANESAVVSWQNPPNAQGNLNQQHLWRIYPLAQNRAWIHHRDGNGTDSGSYVDGAIVKDTYAVHIVQYDYNLAAGTKYIRAYRNDGTSVSRGNLGAGGPTSRSYAYDYLAKFGADQVNGARLNSYSQEYLYYGRTLTAAEVWTLTKALCCKWEIFMAPQLRLDASTQSGADGSIAATWTNSGIWGSSYTFSPVNNPLVKVLGSYKHINFVSASLQRFISNGTAIALTSLRENGITLFFVVRWTDANTYTLFYGGNSSFEDIWVFSESTSGTLRVRVRNGTNVIVSSTANAYLSGNWYIFAVTIDCTQFSPGTKAFLNVYRFATGDSNPEKAPLTTLSNTSTTAITNRIWENAYTFIGYNTSTTYFNGDIRDFLLYDYCMSAPMLRATFAELRSKWGM